MRTPWSKFIVTDKTFILFIFAAGILFRLFLTAVSPQSFAFDQGEYEIYAGKILGDPLFLASFSHRPYGYPLFLAIIYRIFGFGNHQIVFFIQAVLDSSVAIFLYIILRNIGLKRASRVSAFLYAFNPITSAYVGVILSEILATFLLTLSITTGIRFVQKPTLAGAFIFGFVLALGGQTRVAAFLWMLLPIGLLLLLPQHKRYVRYLFAVLVGILIPILYPLWVNWRDYKEISPTTVDNIFIKEFYIGTLTHRPKPFSADLVPQVHYFYRDYYSEVHPERSAKDRHDLSQRYLGLSIENIKKDPHSYYRMVVEKILYLWHTDSLFPYQEPGYEDHRLVTYWANAFILVLAVVGIVRLGAYRFTLSARWMWQTIVATLFYATLTISLSIADHRLTIPFYPLILLSAAVGLDFIWRICSHTWD